MKAKIRKCEDSVERKLCVFLLEEDGKTLGRLIDCLYYDNLDEVDITSIWFEWESEKMTDFQKDFLMKLRGYSRGFVIGKSCLSVKALLDAWQDELKFEPAELIPVKGSKINPNDFVWAFRFKE